MTSKVREYTAEELGKKKTLATGQCCDLKVSMLKYRVWCCRSPEASNEHRVNYEAQYQGRWRPCDSNGRFI